MSPPAQKWQKAKVAKAAPKASLRIGAGVASEPQAAPADETPLPPVASRKWGSGNAVTQTDKIVDARGNGAARRYRIRWMQGGWTAKDDTWEPVSAFEDNAMHLVQQYDMGRVNGSSPSK